MVSPALIGNGPTGPILDTPSVTVVLCTSATPATSVLMPNNTSEALPEFFIVRYAAAGRIVPIEARAHAVSIVISPA